MSVAATVALQQHQQERAMTSIQQIGMAMSQRRIAARVRARWERRRTEVRLVSVLTMSRGKNRAGRETIVDLETLLISPEIALRPIML